VTIDELKRETLTVEEASIVLGIGRTAAYEAARRGQIPAIRIGRRLVVPRAALGKMLSGNGPVAGQGTVLHEVE